MSMLGPSRLCLRTLRISSSISLTKRKSGYVKWIYCNFRATAHLLCLIAELSYWSLAGLRERLLNNTSSNGLLYITQPIECLGSFLKAATRTCRCGRQMSPLLIHTYSPRPKLNYPLSFLYALTRSKSDAKGICLRALLGCWCDYTNTNLLNPDQSGHEAW